jgi:hypothetical protein
MQFRGCLKLPMQGPQGLINPSGVSVIWQIIILLFLPHFGMLDDIHPAS